VREERGEKRVREVMFSAVLVLNIILVLCVREKRERKERKK
jgi:hypothetical protein